MPDVFPTRHLRFIEWRLQELFSDRMETSTPLLYQSTDTDVCLVSHDSHA